MRWEDIFTLISVTPEYSIFLLGLDNAGKTTLLSQIKALFTLHSDGDAEPSSISDNTVSTVSQNVATISLLDIYLKIWDVSGQMSLRRLWQSYCKSAHAVIFVVDSTDLGGDADLSRVQNYFEGRRKSSIGRMEEGSVGWRQEG